MLNGSTTCVTPSKEDHEIKHHTAAVSGSTPPPVSLPAEVSDCELQTNSGLVSEMNCVASDTSTAGVPKLEDQTSTGGAENNSTPPNNPSDDDDDDDEEGEQKKGSKGKSGGKEGKSRRELPAGAVATLKAWLLSPEHFTHPYPTPQDQILLMQKTGIDKKQLKNWFTNARRRIWKPMLKKQLEQGKLAATNAGGGGVAMVNPSGMGGVPGLMLSQQQMAANAIQAGSGASQDGSNQEQSGQGTLPQFQYGQYDLQNNSMNGTGNPFSNPNGPNNTSHPGQQSLAANFNGFMFQNQQQQQQHLHQNQQSGVNGIATSNSIGSLAPMSAGHGSSGNVAGQNSPLMSKTDSHAVLMELFARDQDLVRQASEGSKLKAAAAAQMAAAAQQHSYLGNQHPMKMAQVAAAARGGSSGSLFQVPTLNSWPHFSSVSSLNNLGTLTGVKSITNLSGADLASQGNLNKQGNLAHVKSQESMGRADSYAFLEVFFDNSGNIPGGANRGVKRERDEDNDVGLSLDADESPSSSSNPMKPSEVISSLQHQSSAPSPAPIPADKKDKKSSIDDTDSLKRYHDDALAARGLISVSRSSEKLTNLALPAKMQRTLSQEFMRQQQMTAATGQQFGSHGFASSNNTSNGQAQNTQQNNTSNYHVQQGIPNAPSQQYPGQHPGQQKRTETTPPGNTQNPVQMPTQTCIPISTPLSDPSMASNSVEVPATTKCSLCGCVNVDTQLRPCGHMFHGRCLKPSLQTAMGPPRCPIDHIPMLSAVLAVPTEQKKA
eukprot:CAMPEP_0195512038 /NCGR_PEP_ID=MMETSP0794_2-20130614/4148_1 /TAXON_ID=515487 /ORGANISM="Stephanopyxis turris, Strain CCMP 815" /LENGTH=772 /DNA_ID=CAMNT_0040639755 /DNA_START=266 /DNA_END=2584 /DNA_ORIENTATION=+